MNTSELYICNTKRIIQMKMEIMQYICFSIQLKKKLNDITYCNDKHSLKNRWYKLFVLAEYNVTLKIVIHINLLLIIARTGLIQFVVEVIRSINLYVLNIWHCDINSFPFSFLFTVTLWSVYFDEKNIYYLD